MLVTVLLASASELRADPLTFTGTYFLLDSAGAPESRLDLFSNPGAVLEPRTYGNPVDPYFLFGANVNYEGGESFADTIRFTFQEEGSAPVVFSQNFTTGTNPIRLGFGAVFQPISRTGRPVPATLTVELVNSSPDFAIPAGPNQGQLVDSYTYTFSTLTATPEPSTLLLLGSGAALALRRRARSRANGGALPF